jgi:TolB-like protein
VSLISELKRRNVFRVVAAYVVMSWLLLQIADVASSAFDVPDWTFRFLILVLGIGLIPVAVFSWVFELTPEGIKKESEVNSGQSDTHATGRKLDVATIVMVIIGIVFVVVQQRTQPEPRVQTPVPAVTADAEAPPADVPAAPVVNSRSVAVLPFVNMSSDPENEYFADGLSEELLNQLAQIPDLQIAGRTSSFSFKDKNEDLRVIGNTLGVAHVLEGSVRRQGNQVRVTAQLIRVSDGFHLWSESYDRTMDDVFVIQDDISGNVANALKIVLDETAWEQMQAAGVRNVDAFVEYQKGHELFNIAHGGQNQTLIGTMQEGLAHFDRAIGLVPDFAAAYWQKSDYYAHVILAPDSTAEERANALTELREVLDAAYELAADASRKAFIDVDRVLFSDNWTPLRDRIEKALATTGCPEPTWAEVATGIGYAREAKVMWTRFMRCEPLSTSWPLQLSEAEFWQGDYAGALETLSEGEVLLGANPWFSSKKQRVLMALDRSAEALVLAPQVSGDLSFYGMSAEAIPLAFSGDIEGARAAMEQWQVKNGRNLRNEIEIHAAIGDRDRANELAAEMDARPGGTMHLLLTVNYCACGAPFDLEATPNFSANVRESGIAWPPETHIRFPAKDW